MLAWMRGTNYMASMTRTALAAAEAGWLPDAWLRWGVRRLCRERLGDLVVPVSESQQTQLVKFVAEMDAAPIALVPERANSQHYEVPHFGWQNNIRKVKLPQFQTQVRSAITSPPRRSGGSSTILM